MTHALGRMPANTVVRMHVSRDNVAGAMQMKANVKGIDSEEEDEDEDKT